MTVIYNAERASVPLSARKFEAFTVIVENRVLRGRLEVVPARSHKPKT